MNDRNLFSTASGLVLAALLATGCGGSEPPPAQPSAESADAAGRSWIGRQAAAAIAKAQRELETENIPIGENSGFTVNGRSYDTGRSDGLPRAEISPQGDFLIQGEALPVTEAQRELLLQHRHQLVGLAHAGMAIGIQGADIAGVALTGIGNAIFGGEEGRKAYEERIEAEAARIEDEAMKLCTLLPGLYDSQQALAAALPEFEPYATMTLEDIDECGKDTDVDPEPSIPT